MRSPWRSNYNPTAVEDIPVWVNLMGPCTQIGHALGLAVDLPDLVDRTETAALLRLPTDTWKYAFEGRMADTMRIGDRGRIRLADYGFVALVPARTDTRWWHESFVGAADVWLLRGRLAFGDGKAAAPFPSAIVVWGAEPIVIRALDKAFAGSWHVARRPIFSDLDA